MKNHADPKIVFVARHGLLGDTLVAIPSLVAIRRIYPRAHLVYIGEKIPGQSFVSAQDVLGGTDLVDEFHFYYSGGYHATGLRSLLQLAWNTIVRRPELVIILEPSGRFTRKPLFFRLLGCTVFPTSTNFFTAKRQSRRAASEAAEPMAVQLLRIVQGLGIQADGDETDGARLPLRADACARVDAWLAKLIPHAEGRFLLGLGIWSNMPAKRWPLERYAEVVNRLMKTRPELFPIVLGGAEERTLGEDLVKRWGEGAVAAGEFSIQESAHLLARCSLYLGNDTGVMHLAAAVGTPCVAIFSARDQVGKWYPYGSSRNIVLRREVPCAGCMLTECVQNKMRCLNEITVAEVLAACDLMFAQHGQPTS